MNKLLLSLERKGIRRGNQQGIDTVVKVLKWMAIVYIALMFLGGGIGAYFLIEEKFPNFTPIEFISKYAIYYFVSEFIYRFLLQKLPVGNLKPLLVLNISRKRIVSYFVGKSFISVFNFIQLFFLIPFTIVCISQGTPVLNTLVWFLSLYCIIVSLHFIIILMESYKTVFGIVVGVFLLLGLAQYYDLFDITEFLKPLFYASYEYPISIVLYLAVVVGLIYLTFNYYLNNIYLDGLVTEKVTIGKTQEMGWLDRFGRYSVFLKNDIKLITRNKRAKTTVLMSFLFLFYGLVFVGENSFGGRSDGMFIFMAFFVTGGFLMMFGQYVPSWDSAYYPLLMTQNVSYADYLRSKWLLIIIATIISTLLGTFYIIFSTELFYLILAVGIYNIGVNSLLVLYAGAYLKSPIDLTANKNVFGDKNSFNLKVMVLSLPMFLAPILLFYIGKLTFGFFAGILLLVLAGIIGMCCTKLAFKYIEKLYLKEKYDALKAYKKTN